jgi:nucleoside-diphosphate-sugar epimerase
MSVLLIGISGSSGEAIVTRLIAQGDEVRVVEDDQVTAEQWRSLGAHVARPDDDMSDLIERAAQNVRTVVIGEAVAHDVDEVRAIVDGAAAARVERIVLFGAGASHSALEAVREFPFQHVVLSTGRRRLLGGSLDDESLAAAVDAADDIAGEPRLELDLGDPEAWPVLGLSPP